jgi:hypothetical protein
MSLFSTLLRLQVSSHGTPTEDYLTELFAYALQEYPAIMDDFLKLVKIKKAKDSDTSLRTQYRFPKLKGHERESVPDMILFLSDHTVIIENKVGSTEGYQQLKRYAEHLNALKETKRTLVFITRDYEPKEKEKITRDCTEEINYIELRWHHIFRLLKPYAKDASIQQILIFMSDKSLASNNRFSPMDIAAMSNFGRVRNMLDHSMNGKALAEFKKIAGGVSKQVSNDKEYKTWDRYIYYKHKGKIAIYLGYWMNGNSEKDYPEVGLMIQVKIEGTKAKKINDVFRSILKETNNKWTDNTTDAPNGYSQIYLKKGINELLYSEDHIQRIEQHFLDCLKEYERIEPQLNPYL